MSIFKLVDVGGNKATISLTRNPDDILIATCYLLLKRSGTSYYFFVSVRFRRFPTSQNPPAINKTNPKVIRLLLKVAAVAPVSA